MPDAGLIVFPDEQPVTGAEPMSMFDPRTKRGTPLLVTGMVRPRERTSRCSAYVVDAKPDDVL
jgi:hypothetical protein